MRLLAVWLINTIALLALPYMVPWIRIDGSSTASWWAGSGPGSWARSCTA